jgi:ferredoxin-type protein NapH
MEDGRHKTEISPASPFKKGGLNKGKHNETPPLEKGGKGGFEIKWLLKLSKVRRIVLLGIVALFLLQFFGMDLLVGGLTGSVAVLFVRLIDVFAYLESLIASRDFTTLALISVLPVIGVYIIFGRAFCGWVCPMDFLFELINRTKDWSGKRVKVPNRTGYIIAGTFLALSGIIGIPIFTNYVSHLTNFFRAISSGVYLALNLPAEPVVLYFSVAVICSLLILEFAYPRLWCRVLCPVGKTYGLFNKVSLLRLKFTEGDCGECNLCEQVCYMNVNITPYLDQPYLRDTNCIYCGKCVEGCGTKGKIVKMTLSLPFNKRETEGLIDH